MTTHSMLVLQAESIAAVSPIFCLQGYNAKLLATEVRSCIHASIPLS